MTSALEVAHYFLAKQDEAAGELITNLKLQKLVYYAQGFHLAVFDKPLFPEQIKAWEHGPVVPQLWHVYKDYGSKPLPLPDDVSAFDSATRELLDEVADVYGQFSAWRLRELTHSEPPWIEAFNSPSKIVQRDSMRRYFTTRLAQDS
jgi:uncharacterized phage-associated protein